ncbi:phage major capsid protein [Ligilactobacillus ceti]|uniref:HK97 family phage major capsid protein n=1 Tax=Ligilactobacillus ceti DSM 22408 TaxID=1122146 RepID=A0A0R2KH93_9LACO|nr:phage major capsid protein [Ligilactobacillus ceti]KRN88728.1 HK97 family phage major capsid protein [Ligilactobacillus ceti DSM 22408]
MNKVLEMIEKRNKAWNTAKNFVEEKQDKDGLLSEEDAKVYNELEQKVRDYSVQIERLKEMEEMDKELSKPINQAITEKPQNVKIETEKKEEKKGRARDEYKKAMLSAFRSNFRNVNNILQEGIDTDGGYLVPDEYDDRLVTTLKEENIIRKLAYEISTSGKHKINIAATDPAAAWIEEGGELTFGESKFKQINLDAHKLHVAIKITEELLYDNAFNLENYVMEAFGKALANAEEDAFLNGDGNNKPTGIFHKTKGGNLLKEVTALKADDLAKLVYALKRPYRKNASFILNDKLIAEIRTLKDNNGTYIWQPSYQDGEPDRLLGYKVYTSAYAPEDKIAFGDFSYYNIGDRGTRSFQELKELFAGNGMVGFVAKERVDGKLILQEAVQILPIKATGK